MENYIGKRYGKLTLIAKSRRPLTSKRARSPYDVWWKCRCDCGKITVVHRENLGVGRHKTKSCGCTSVTHGLSRHVLYNTWQMMLRRCRSPKVPEYGRYGGRGIRVCAGWHDFVKFYRWAIENGWKKGLTIDRINPNGNYSPSNCRWATYQQQGENRRDLVYIVYKGEKMHLAEAARRARLPHETLRLRVKRGWPPERLFIASTRPRKKKSS